MAILNFRFISVAFSAHFLKIKTKQALLSLFLKILGGSSKEADNKKADSKVINSKIAHSKNTGSGKVRGFSTDFTLYIF